MDEQGAVTTDLDSLFWLGGSTCIGKTTICTRLSERFHVDIHHRDDAIDDHGKRANPRDYPAICEWYRLRTKEGIRAVLDRTVDGPGGPHDIGVP